MSVPEPAAAPQASPVRLWDVAHSRAGDKGDASILLISPYRREDFPALAASLTTDRLACHFMVSPEEISVVPSPALGAVTIVVRNRLAGGVTRSPRVDPHGKTLSGHLLDLVVPWPADSPRQP